MIDKHNKSPFIPTCSGLSLSLTHWLLCFRDFVAMLSIASAFHFYSTHTRTQHVGVIFCIHVPTCPATIVIARARLSVPLRRRRHKNGLPLAKVKHLALLSPCLSVFPGGAFVHCTVELGARWSVLGVTEWDGALGETTPTENARSKERQQRKRGKGGEIWWWCEA